MSNQYQAVAAVLQSAIKAVNAILTSSEDEMHRIRLANRLQQEADQLLLLTGSGDLTAEQTPVLGPATTIGGKPVGKVRRFTTDDMVPADDKVNNLRKQVENAIVYFGPKAQPTGIIANIPELIIRGVAKKAGLQVTKDEPKEITVEFIEKIKEALAAAGIKGEVEEDNDEFDEKEYQKQKFVIAGGTAEVMDSTEVIGAPMGAGKVEADNQPSELVEAPEPLNTVEPVPTVSEQPKPDEHKQDPKPDPKKKGSK